jgi:hypothetical protein
MNAAHDTQGDEILWYSNVKEARQCVSLRTSQVSDANAFSGANIAQMFHVFIVTIFDVFCAKIDRFPKQTIESPKFGRFYEQNCGKSKNRPFIFGRSRHKRVNLAPTFVAAPW